MGPCSSVPLGRSSTAVPYKGISCLGARRNKQANRTMIVSKPRRAPEWPWPSVFCCCWHLRPPRAPPEARGGAAGACSGMPHLGFAAWCQYPAAGPRLVPPRFLWPLPGPRRRRSQMDLPQSRIAKELIKAACAVHCARASGRFHRKQRSSCHASVGSSSSYCHDCCRNWKS